jgi:hypothetical protein
MSLRSGTTLVRARLALIAPFRTRPWIGWVTWYVFVAIAIARIHPRRFNSTFMAYLDAADRLLAREHVYNPLLLGDFLYFPISLLIHAPLTRIDTVAAAAVVLMISAGLFTWACAALASALLGDRAGSDETIALSGVVLLVNIPAAWFNFKGIQAQVPMTAAMIAATTAMVGARWRVATFWLFVAIVMKPLALVMVLLCGALVREMRWPLIAAMIVVILLPFAFVNWSYLISEYHAMGLKLWHIATVPALDWPYQADFSTMLRVFGVQLPSSVALATRLAAALGTLMLAWRVKQTGSPRSLAVAVLVLSGCYITLFGPRNEFLSFVVLTPSLAVLAGLMLMRDDADYRGWLLVVAAVTLGFAWNLEVDAVLKPAIVVVVYLWLTWLMVAPARWRAIVEPGASVQSGGDDEETAVWATARPPLKSTRSP